MHVALSFIALSVVTTASAQGDGERKVWVYCIDKGETQGLALSSGLVRAEANLLPAARERRARSMAGRLVDERDVPVYAPYVDALVAQGATLRHRSRWLNAVSIAASDKTISAIERLPFVKKVTPVVHLARSGTRTIAPRGAREKSVRSLPLGAHHAQGDTAFYGEAFYQLDEIRVPEVHDAGYTGAGVLVGMFDTGFYKVHEALRGQPIVAEHDFVFADGQTQNEPEDVSGQHDHGTLTWSALGGYAPYTMIGPAYGASFFLAKTEDIRTETPVEEDYYVAALEWADSLGVSVVSASLAYRDFDDPFPDYAPEDIDGNTAVITVAVDVAASRGILVANAMANEGPDPGSLWTPADADSMLAVGAVYPGEGMIADFSSRGPTFDGRIKPEVVARGVDTFCAFSYSPDAYGGASGTSLSTPLVGGAVALVFEAHPEWGAMAVRDALLQTADNQATPDNDRGWGRIDVYAAIFGVTPPVFPIPFSLILPPDGDSTGSEDIEFAWEASDDPDGGGPVTYTLLVARDEALSDIVLETSTEGNTLIVDGVTGPDTSYYWSVRASDEDMRERQAREVWRFSRAGQTSLDPEEGLPLARTGLFQNSPNPFNPSTVITFSVGGDRKAHVKLEIFDVRGRRIKTLISDNIEPGMHRLTWNGTDRHGRSVGSGIYFCRLAVEGLTMTRKMNLLR
jgi:subtilisin family serine protease